MPGFDKLGKNVIDKISEPGDIEIEVCFVDPHETECKFVILIFAYMFFPQHDGLAGKYISRNIDWDIYPNPIAAVEDFCYFAHEEITR